MDVEGLLADLSLRWRFSAVEELPAGYCCRVFADRERVLRIPFQGEERTSGLRAAMALSGCVGPRVFEADEVSGALLMERVSPGTNLAEAGVSEADALSIAIDLIQRVRETTCDEPMTLASYYGACLGAPPFEGEPIFLHGDLHHYNILLGKRGWVAIDPKGLLGDPAYEAIAFLRNPFDQFPNLDADLGALLLGRLRRFEEALGFNPDAMLNWLLYDLRCGEASREPGHPWGRLQAVVENLSKGA